MTEKTEKLDRVIAAYVKLRDAKTAMAKRHKEELSPITDKMDFLEGYLQKFLLDRNMESMRTEQGTAFLQRVSSATVKDWTATLAFIQKNKEWSFLDARVNKTAVKDYIEASGQIPPGVEFTEMIVTRVRR